MTTQIWMLTSKVLGGFYQSDVIVLADDKEAAVEIAVAAIDAHIDAELEEYLFCSIDGRSLDPDDDDFARERAEVLENFRAEARAKIAPVPNGRLVLRKS